MFSFLQGIKENNLNTVFYAIDTWKGDNQTGFFKKNEGDSCFEEIKIILQKYYNNINVNLKRTTFDEAVNEFKDNSIDLLHIDGLHTYDAVKNDFAKWFPKCTQDAVILFHDINDIPGFGVKQFWDELKINSDGFYFSFSHSNGLGIFTQDKNKSLSINDLINCNKIKYFELLYEELKKDSIDLNYIYVSKFWKFRSFLKKVIRRK